MANTRIRERNSELHVFSALEEIGSYLRNRLGIYVDLQARMGRGRTLSSFLDLLSGVELPEPKLMVSPQLILPCREQND